MSTLVILSLAASYAERVGVKERSGKYLISNGSVLGMSCPPCPLQWCPCVARLFVIAINATDGRTAVFVLADAGVGKFQSEYYERTLGRLGGFRDALS